MQITIVNVTGGGSTLIETLATVNAEAFSDVASAFTAGFLTALEPDFGVVSIDPTSLRAPGYPAPGYPSRRRLLLSVNNASDSGR